MRFGLMTNDRVTKDNPDQFRSVRDQIRMHFGLLGSDQRLRQRV